MNIEPILLTTVRVQTYQGGRHLTNATGFFFERDERLFLVSSLHVFIDPLNEHHPDRLEIELHIGEEHLSRSVFFSIPLFANGLSIWHTCSDSGGDVDVAVIEINRAALPGDTVYRAFSPAHLPQPEAAIEVGHHKQEVLWGYTFNVDTIIATSVAAMKRSTGSNARTLLLISRAMASMPKPRSVMR